VPVIYGEIADLPKIAARFDAVVATSYITIYWLAPLAQRCPELPIAYFIQDYEPYFDPPGSEGYHKAAASYTLLPNLVRVCTTSWIADQIQQQFQSTLSPSPILGRGQGEGLLSPSPILGRGQGEGLPLTLIGPCFDADLFVPRPQPDPPWPAHPLRVVAMIRPSTPRRSPLLTMQVLERASRELGDQGRSNPVEIILFGADRQELHAAGLLANGVRRSKTGVAATPAFPFKLAGRLGQRQVANLMNAADIFVDFSSFQALGVTALEAMACGVATIVPQHGGVQVFARHEVNSLVVDSHDPDACFASLHRLVTDHDLRLKLQTNGLLQAPQYYPDRPAYIFLQALFGRESGRQP